MNRLNYYLHKDSKTGEIIYLEYEKIPDLREKLIRKKVEIKIRYLLKALDELDDDADDSAIKDTLLKAEKLRIDIINKYIKYLGNTYGELSMKKISILVNQLRMKLFDNMNKRNYSAINDLYYLDDEEPKRGRGR